MGEWHSRGCSRPAAFYHLFSEVLHAINRENKSREVGQFSSRVITLVYVDLSCAVLYRSRCSGSKFMTVEGWRSPGEKKHNMSHTNCRNNLDTKFPAAQLPDASRNSSYPQMVKTPIKAQANGEVWYTRQETQVFPPKDLHERSPEPCTCWGEEESLFERGSVVPHSAWDWRGSRFCLWQKISTKVSCEETPTDWWSHTWTTAERLCFC